MVLVYWLQGSCLLGVFLGSRSRKNSVFKGPVEIGSAKTSADYSKRTNWTLIVLGCMPSPRASTDLSGQTAIR